jgi:hypothetical protein
MLMLVLAMVAHAGPPDVVVVTDAPPAVVVTEVPERHEMRSGPSVGLSGGMATGFGPTLGIPLGQHLSVQLTALPVIVPDAGGGGTGGIRLQQYLGKNPRTRLYLVEGAGLHGWDDSWMWGVGVGAGVETRKDWSTGLTKWLDISITALGSEEMFIVLPLPQAGVAWVF